MAASDVVTQHNNPHRTGAYLAETHLTPANVRDPAFGLLYERAVKGDVCAQPLFVQGVKTAAGLKNLVFIATSTNDVYAFDADNASSDPYAGGVWHRRLDPCRPLVPGVEICLETLGSVGITSTPVIDTKSKTMYVVTRRSGGTIVARGVLYQLHNDGTIWRYTGTPLTGWQLLDNNPATVQISANMGAHGLYQLHRDGTIWRYTGTPLTGWRLLDNNPATVAIAAAGASARGVLYQLHNDGTIWRYTGTPLTGWQLLDNNPATVEIVAAPMSGRTRLYQRHRDGTIWEYTGTPLTGWRLLDNNPATVQLTAAGGAVYQLHNDGTIWRYTGTPLTGWQLLDNNPRTVHIAATAGPGGAGGHLYQMHIDGKIWVYTGTPLTGWQLLDSNPTTAQIVVDDVNDRLYQVHIDGSIWQYTGPPMTGWLMLDNNWAVNDGANYLHAIDIADGSERPHSPIRIQATDPHNPAVRFDARWQRNRPGLLLLRGVVYLGFGTFSCDQGPYHGWVLGYRATDLSQVGVFCTSSDGGGAGIWQSGKGLVGANDGSIYFETGNDTVRARLGDSFIRLRATSAAPGLAVAGSFTPRNANTLRDGGPLSPAAATWYGHPRGPGDTDLGSGGPILLPGNRVVGGGKQGRYYVLDAATMRLSQNATPDADGFEGFQAFKNTWHPTFTHRDYEMGEGFGPNIHGGPIYWAGTGYLYEMSEKDYLKAFQYDAATGHVHETPARVASGSWARARDGMPGGFSSLSANGKRDGIIWLSQPQRDGQWVKVPGVLAAFDAATLKQLWVDKTPQSFAKFVPPTVAKGRVYRATFASDVHHGIRGKVLVYGLHHRPRSSAAVDPATAPIISPDDPTPRPLDETYRRYGGPHGVLGLPLGDSQQIGDQAGGRFQDFQAVVRAGTGVQGSVRAGDSGDEPTCYHPDRGATRTLEASIYWSPETGAHVVEGEIRDLWRQTGAEQGPLGYPTSDETNTPDAAGRMNRFQHGTIVWYPDSGAKVEPDSAPPSPPQ